MEDGLEYLVGERIGEVLNEAKSRRKRHYKEEEKYLEKGGQGDGGRVFGGSSGLVL